MYVCPSCNTQVTDFELNCPRCECDLEVLARVNEFPDLQFNSALRESHAGNWMPAMQLTFSVLNQRLQDVDAWLLLGVLFARRALWEPARECWAMVGLLQPHHATARRYMEILESLSRSGSNSSTESTSDTRSGESESHGHA